MASKHTPITYDHRTLTLKQWAEHLGIKFATLDVRYKRGLRPPELFAPTVKTIATIPINYHGQTMQLRHWADKLYIPYPTLRMRYVRGIRPPELLRPLRQPVSLPIQTPHQIYLTHNMKTHSLYEWSRLLNTGFSIAHARYLRGERDFAKLWAEPLSIRAKAMTSALRDDID